MSVYKAVSVIATKQIEEREIQIARSCLQKSPEERNNLSTEACLPFFGQEYALEDNPQQLYVWRMISQTGPVATTGPCLSFQDSNQCRLPSESIPGTVWIKLDSLNSASFIRQKAWELGEYGQWTYYMGLTTLYGVESWF